MPEAGRGRGRGKGQGRSDGGAGQGGSWQQNQPSFGPPPGFGYGFPPPFYAGQYPGQFPNNQWVNPQGNWANPPNMQQPFPPLQPYFQQQSPPPQMQQQFPPGQLQGSQQVAATQAGGIQQAQKVHTQQQPGKQGAAKNQKKGKSAPSFTEGQSSNKDKESIKAKDSYLNAICYNCGEPGHNKSSCPQAPFCFICKMTTHKEDACPIRKQKLPVASLFGAANPGLEFLHIDCPEIKQGTGASCNVGIVFIEAGEISKEELAKEFAVIYKTNWPWPIRELDGWSFLVKFPPHLPVEDVAGYPCFGLLKEGVTVTVEVWDGEIEACEESHEVWIQLRGLNSDWCNWASLAQFTSAFGIMEDIDWIGAFKSFYDVVRVKLLCTDPTLIPTSRIFEIYKKFHKIRIEVEPPSTTAPDNSEDPSDPGDDQSGSRKTGNEMDTEHEPDKNTGPAGSSGAEKEANSTGGSTTHRQVNSLSYGAAFSNSDIDIPQALETVRKDILSWLNAENPDEGKCYDLLREMEVVNEEGYFCYDKEEDSLSGDGLAPTEQNTNLNSEESFPRLAVEVSQEAANVTHWGPVHGTRQSSRLQGHGGKTVMEMAQDIKKRKNMEGPAASKFQGLVANSQNYQEMETDFQVFDAGEDRQLCSESVLDPERETHTRVGVIPRLSGMSLSPLVDSLSLHKPSVHAPATPPSQLKLKIASPITPYWHGSWTGASASGMLPPHEAKAKLTEILETHKMKRVA